MLLIPSATAWCLLTFAIRSKNVVAYQLDKDLQPEQIHLSIGESNQDIVITWVTMKKIIPPTVTVEFGIDDLDAQTKGKSKEFIDGGSEHRSMWMHRVVLKDLIPETRYVYRVGSPRGWSELFNFTTWKAGNDWPVRLAMLGDMSLANPQSLPRLELDSNNGMYDAVIHIGDIAYNLAFDNARVGDKFMRKIQSVAAYVPYLTSPGNHEYMYNFSNYRARFSMPNYEETENLFYSWNMGPVHFISINTEVYFFLQYGLSPVVRQYEWLVNDLKEANKPEARSKRPWIILFGHRPMYCSISQRAECSEPVRVGLPILKTYGLETLLYEYGVDLAVWAHTHVYERLLPIFNFTLYNGSPEAPYVNAKAPVHVTMSAGGLDYIGHLTPPSKPHWSAFSSVDFGYSRLTVYNATHLYWDQISVDKDGEIDVIDDVWVIQEKHGPYPDLRFV